jgi:hypothetical protein
MFNFLIIQTHINTALNVFIKVLSRVYNNGVWIGWLDLLTPSFTISRQHNKLQTYRQSTHFKNH